MSSSKEKEIVAQVIDVYKEMPYLWQKEHKDYKNHDVRSEAYKVLLEIYKNFDEKATIKTIKKKIDNMRTNYAKELKKVVSSKRTGAGTEEVYTPSLWYFETFFSFLGHRTESCRAVTDSLDQNLTSSDEDAASLGDTASLGDAASVGTFSSGLQKRKKKEESVIQKQAKLLSSAEKMLSQKDEEWEIFGRSIGFQMKDLNKRQLIISQKIISDVIFYAKLNKLCENSYVVTTPAEEFNSKDHSFHERQNQFYSPSPPLSYYSSPSPHQSHSPHHPSPSPTQDNQFSPVISHWPRYQTKLGSSSKPLQSQRRQKQLSQLTTPNSLFESSTSCQPSSSNTQVPAYHSTDQLSPSRQSSPNIKIQEYQSNHKPSPNIQVQAYHSSRQPSPSPNIQVQAHHSSHQPSPSPKVQVQAHHSSHQPSPNVQIKAYESTPQPSLSSNLLIQAYQSTSQPSPDFQAQAFHSSHQPSPAHQPSLEVQAQAPYSSQQQSLPSDDIIVVNHAEEFLNFLPEEDSSDTNLSFSVTEGPGNAMKEFLIMKPKKKKL